MDFMEEPSKDVCPKCGSSLAPIETTSTGRRIQRCSTGSWNPLTRKSEGCDYVVWHKIEPKELEEKCPKCGSLVLLVTTRFGKKMKRCSAGGWDAKTKQPTGCDFVEWISGTSQNLDEECPSCGEKLVLYTTSRGKQMKRCSTAGWDGINKKATGCTYVKWLKASEYQA